MLVLGIDPGSRVAGWGIVEEKGNVLRAVAYGTVKPPAPMAKKIERFGYIFGMFKEIVDKYSPDEAAVETVFFAENARSSLILGHARAAALLPALLSGIPVAEYSALQVKKASTGQGRAEKSQVGNMVGRILGLATPPKPADVTDALAVAICHINSAPMRRMGGGR